MPTECPDCNTQSVIEEEENGKVHHVCMECGHILSETAILSSEAVAQPIGEHFKTERYGCQMDTHSKWKMNTRPIDPKGRQMGKQLIKAIGHLFKFRDDMTEYATQLFFRVYDEKVRNCRLDTKKILCACCIYVTGRENDYGITVRDLARFIDAPKGVRKFGAMLQLLKSEYNISVKEVGPGLEAYNFLSKASFPLDLIKLTQRILQLLQQLWIVTGKSRTLVIIASAFCAWKSKEPVKNKKVTVRSFCKMFNFTYSRPVSDRRKEIYETFRKLAQQIPWLKRDGQDINIEYHINDILEFQQGLCQNAIDAAVAEFRKEGNGKRCLESVQEFGPFLPPPSKSRKLNPKSDTDEQSMSSSLYRAHRNDTVSCRIFENDDGDDEYCIDIGSEDDIDDYIIVEEELKKYKAMHMEEIDPK